MAIGGERHRETARETYPGQDEEQRRPSTVSIASSIAYVVSLAATLYWYRQVSGGSVWGALIARPSDRRFYGELLQKLRARAGTPEKGAT